MLHTRHLVLQFEGSAEIRKTRCSGRWHRPGSFIPQPLQPLPLSRRNAHGRQLAARHTAEAGQEICAKAWVCGDDMAQDCLQHGGQQRACERVLEQRGQRGRLQHAQIGRLAFPVCPQRLPHLLKLHACAPSTITQCSQVVCWWEWAATMRPTSA